MMFDEDLEMQSCQTDDILISACPVLVEEEAKEDELLWGYYLCIENNSEHKIHVVGKNWNITDDKGNLYCDDSMGFKGEIPELEPGECFEFTSTAPIKSPNAVFYGSCKIMDDKKKVTKDVRIPTFSLSAAKDDYYATIN